MEKRILIADDSEELCEFLRAHLQSLGYEVQTVRSGDEVLRLLDREIPDLLILDVMMPKPNGFQICRKIKSDSRFQDIPVMMLTARSRSEDVYWGKDCGADEYLTKPFRTAELERRVNHLISKKKTARKQQQEPLRWVRFEKGFPKKTSSSEETVHCFLKWNSRSARIFRKKYGEIQFEEAMDGVFEIIRVFLKGEEMTAGIEFQEATGIQLLMQADRVQVEDLTRKITFHLNHLLRSFYSSEDLQKNGVVFKKYGSKKESRVPLLEFEPTLNFFPGC